MSCDDIHTILINLGDNVWSSCHKSGKDSQTTGDSDEQLITNYDLDDTKNQNIHTINSQFKSQLCDMWKWAYNNRT